MAPKRRYYRQERRDPVYQDEFEDLEDQDEDDNLAEMNRVIKGTTWSILAFLAAGAILSIAHSLYKPSPSINLQGQGYRVIAVSQGKLHTVEIGTGEKVSFPDQDLVRKALNGMLKNGDVIYK